MKEKWSSTARRAVEPIYQEILRHPFVTELAAGTLDRGKFLFYLGQDAMYLERYARVLAHVASRLTDKAAIADVLRFATDGIAVESALHATFLQGAPLPPMSPTCLMYTAVEEAQSFAPAAVEAASLLPCFLIYQQVGQAILTSCTNIDTNPYARWILTYADEVFAESTRRYTEICDSLATDGLCGQMTDIFITCTRLEWMFWDSAYHLEQWKV